MSELNTHLEQSFLDQVSVVLMRTTHPGNIGAVARACKNMGVSDIRLVDPSEYPSEVATRRASGAEDILANARVFDSLDEAIEDCHCVFGSSARSRKMVWPNMNPREAAEFVRKRHLKAKQDGKDSEKIALLFGQEASGLSNEELHRCNYHVTIPANPSYSSLNLAMAVQVICYEFRLAGLDISASANDSENSGNIEPVEGPSVVAPILNPDSAGWDVEVASVSEVEGMLNHLEELLVETGYHDPKNPRVLMQRFRRLFQRAHLDRMEVNILRGMYKAVLKQVASTKS